MIICNQKYEVINLRKNTRNRGRRNNKHNNDINYSKANKILLFTILILAIILAIVVIFYYLKNNNSYQNIINSYKQELEAQEQEQAKIAEEEKQNAQKQETDTTFTLTAIGDVMCHNTQYMDAYDRNTGTYDFSYVFDNISSYTKTTDICIGNLETSFAGEDRGYSNYPTFNSPDSLADSLKRIGVDVLSTAGNHALDMGFSGLSRTIDVLDKADISHLGTYKTQEDQDKVLIKYVKGVKIAFINYTYGTNGISVPSDKKFCINLIDKDLIKKHIETAKNQNADIIVACMHWGTEYQTKQNSEQEELADFLFQNGVNVIIGNHPHVIQPMEKRTVTLEDGSTRDGFVAYALGNFICDQNAVNTRDSIILNLKITKHTDGSITIDNYDYVPIYMYKDSSVSKHKMKILDINKTIYNYENNLDDSITEKIYNLMKTELGRITKILND